MELRDLKKTRNQSGKYINETINTDHSAFLEHFKTIKEQQHTDYSELITVDNKVAAIFVKDGAEKAIPKELLQFAKERNLPLVVVHNTTS